MELCRALFVLLNLVTLMTSHDPPPDVQSAAKALGEYLTDTFTSRTSYQAVLASYQASEITGTLHPDSYWIEEVLEPIKAHTELVMRSRYEAVMGFKAKVLTDMSQYQVDSALIEEEEEHGEEEDHLLKWYSSPDELIDLFTPVVKIANPNTTHDIFLAEHLLKQTQPDNLDNYFLGTTFGILKFHPARKWPKEQDVYDCIHESWFLDPASSSHDVALLVDKSRSVKGMTLKIMRDVTSRLIKELPENYRFNVFLFNNKTVPLSECLGTDPLPATKLIKNAMLSELDNFEIEYKAHLNDALLEVEKMFFKPSTNTTCEPERMVILLTDGLLEFDQVAVTETLNRLNTKLISIESAHPLSLGDNKPLKAMTCELGGVFQSMDRIVDWFNISDIFSTLSQARSIKDRTQVSPWWSDPSITMFNDTMSMILSYPLYNQTGEESHELLAVLGTEVLLRDFTTDYPGTAGSLAYPIVTLPNGRVISHPRLLTSPFVPMSFQLQEDKEQTDSPERVLLYPLPYLTDSPITKVYKILEEEGGQTEGVVRNVKYRLVVPANDAVDVAIKPGPQPQTNMTPRGRLTTVPCLQSSKCTTKLTTDKELTSAVGSEHDNEFLVTRHGLLRTTLPSHQDPDPRNVSEFVEFSADPSKLPGDVLLLTNTFTDQIVLSKSISKTFELTMAASGSMNRYKSILAVHGLGLSYQDFSYEIDNILSSKQLTGVSNYSVYLLDHKGYTVYPNSGSQSRFFGELHGGVFRRLVEEGFYTRSSFQDCICSNMTSSGPSPLTSSAGRVSWFIRDFITRSVTLLLSVSFNILSWVEQGVSFLTDKRNGTLCCRNITSYERDFSRGSWNCTEECEYCSEGLRAEDSEGLRAEDSEGLHAEDSEGLRAEDSEGLRAEDSEGLHAEDSEGLRAEDTCEYCSEGGSGSPRQCEVSRLASVHPVPATTLLMITVRHASTPCNCSTASQPLKRYANTVVNKDYCKMAMYEKNNYSRLNPAGPCFTSTEEARCYKTCCRQGTSGTP